MLTFIKLDINILDDAKIKIIRSHPDGDKVIVLWIGLLCLAMKSFRPGLIEITDGLPYTSDDLANLFNLEKKTVEMGVALFRKYKMIEIFDNGTIDVINFSKHQKLEDIEHKRELTRLRVEKFRNKNKPCNALLTHNSVTVTSTDIDIDIDIDKDKRRNDENFVLPSKELIQESSDPMVLAQIDKVCEKLYLENIFPQVNAFKNSMMKLKKNPRSVLHTLCRAYVKREFEEGPWAYCTKIIKSEDLNYNERDYFKTS